jgi:hypothetical protein
LLQQQQLTSTVLVPVRYLSPSQPATTFPSHRGRQLAGLVSGATRLVKSRCGDQDVQQPWVFGGPVLIPDTA